ncbi:MAG: heme-copper oxidase subunit III [Planctomycetota bacterium]
MQEATPAIQPDPTPSQRPPRQHVPRGTAEFGMWLLLASLTVLFAASLLAYALIRLGVFGWPVDPTTGIRPEPPAPSAVQMPAGLWASTLVILASSYTIHRAVGAVRRERQSSFRHWLLVTMGLAAVFLLVQAPSLAELLGRQSDAAAGPGSARLFHFAFFLIVVHALHVVGGVIPLCIVVRAAHRGRYDHEYHTPVRTLAMYWHFLDVIWLAMFGVLLALG